MDDYISRQEAIKSLLELTTFKTKRELVERIESSIADENGWIGGVAECMDEIEDLPSADVQPVRHGHWIHDGLDIPHGVDWMHCSECGKRDKYCPAAMTNYCPNCGAKMDGEQND